MKLPIQSQPITRNLCAGEINTNKRINSHEFIKPSLISWDRIALNSMDLRWASCYETCMDLPEESRRFCLAKCYSSILNPIHGGPYKPQPV
jgi:hypothetical protein